MIFSSAAIKILSQITNQQFILPFYHAVADSVPVHLKYLYKVRTTKQFEHDLDTLLKLYKPVSLNEIVDHLNNKKALPRYAFHVSFDDGLSEFGEFAWPILKRKGIPVSLFVNPSFVDNKELFFRFKASILINFIKENPQLELVKEANKLVRSIVDSVDNLVTFIRNVSYPQKKVLDDIATYLQIDFYDYLARKKPYTSLTALKKLSKEGVFIGAHSMDHPLFNQLNDIEKKAQVVKSVDWVERNLNQGYKAFSFPFTDYGVSHAFFEKLYNTNEPIIDVSFGTAGIKKESFKNHLQRIPIEESNLNIGQQLLKQYLYYIAKSPFLKNTIRR